MNDEMSLDPSQPFGSAPEPEPITLGMSSLYKLFESFIALREKNTREHRMFEQNQNRTRDTLIERFNAFVSETHRAYQSFRQELTGEKRLAIAILNELVDVGLELEHIAASQPKQPPEGEQAVAWRKWAEAIEVQSRKVQAALGRHGIHPYDAVIGSLYNPGLHERVGSKRVEGMDALRVAEQKEHGYASQLPEFVLRRPKVIVSE